MRDASDSSMGQMIRAGIAPRRARRILREFREHRADLIAEQRSLGADEKAAVAAAEARLGSEQLLVAETLGRPELRSWTRRRPALVFVLAPPLCFAATFCASLLGLVAVVDWLKAHGESMTRGSPLIYGISEYGPPCLLWGLPLGVAVALIMFAARRRETSVWPYIGVLLTCFLGSLTNFSVYLPPMAAAPSMGAGLGISTDDLGPVLLRTAATAVLAVILYAWSSHTVRRRSTP